MRGECCCRRRVQPCNIVEGRESESVRPREAACVFSVLSRERGVWGIGKAAQVVIFSFHVCLFRIAWRT